MDQNKLDRLIHELCRTRFDLPFPMGHFYNPVPDVEAISRRKGRWLKEYDFTGVDLDLERQRATLDSLAQYRPELDRLDDFGTLMKAGLGPGYGEIEAMFLHMMLRRLKPRAMIEVGSGVSTLCSTVALEMNRDLDNAPCALTCIEPYPSDALRAYTEAHSISLAVSEVQEMDAAFFSRLGEGDVLFIDSSHVCKTDSDVTHLYSEILPRLARGVVIHIHDICFPYFTPMDDHPVFHETIFWTEPMVVKAFLTFNSAFEITLCESWLHFKHPDLVARAVPAYDPARHTPSSLWLRKTL
jgi:predicted O-methyltransferase YrrM